MNKKQWVIILITGVILVAAGVMCAVLLNDNAITNKKDTGKTRSSLDSGKEVDAAEGEELHSKEPDGQETGGSNVTDAKVRGDSEGAGEIPDDLIDTIGEDESGWEELPFVPFD